jgi:flagellar biosynthesis protein FliQ
MDDITLAVEAARKALLVALELSAPVLAVGMLVGLIVSVVQAATQIQDQTLSFVPKILAIATALFFLLPWLLQVATGYLEEALLGLRIAS